MKIGVLDPIDPGRTIFRVGGIDVGVFAHGGLLVSVDGVSVDGSGAGESQAARPTMKLTVVVALPPMFSVAKRRAPAT